MPLPPPSEPPRPSSAPAGDARRPRPPQGGSPGGTARGPGGARGNPQPERRSQRGEPGLPDMRRYAAELQAMLRQRSPAAYRVFLRQWGGLHERGVAERLAAMDDAVLRLRIERMILDTPELSDLHKSARDYVAAQSDQAKG